MWQLWHPSVAIREVPFKVNSLPVKIFCRWCCYSRRRQLASARQTANWLAGRGVNSSGVEKAGFTPPSIFKRVPQVYIVPQSMMYKYTLTASTFHFQYSTWEWIVGRGELAEGFKLGVNNHPSMIHAKLGPNLWAATPDASGSVSCLWETTLPWIMAHDGKPHTHNDTSRRRRFWPVGLFADGYHWSLLLLSALPLKYTKFLS